MDITENYTTDDVMFNEPCDAKYIGRLYPILVKDYTLFLKNVKYLMISEKQVEINLLQGVLLLGISELSKEDKGKDVDGETVEKYFNVVADSIATLISLVSRKEIKYTCAVSGDYITASFFDEEETIVVNDGNWLSFRKIVMMQNNIQEIKIYEDKITAEWMEKYNSARSENNNITIGDILAIVSNASGKSYAELKNQNILQLNADYHRIAHVENYRTVAIYQSEQINKMKFVSGIIEELYKDREDEKFIGEGDLGI